MTHHTAASVFVTDRLNLRPFISAHAPSIVASLNDAEMCYGLTVVPFPYHLDDANWFINEGSKDALAVCLCDGSLIGAVGLEQHFSQSNAPVVSSYVDDNHGSASVLAKLGFEITGDTMLPIKSRDGAFPAKEVRLSKARWDQTV